MSREIILVSPYTPLTRKNNTNLKHYTTNYEVLINLLLLHHIVKLFLFTVSIREKERRNKMQNITRVSQGND